MKTVVGLFADLDAIEAVVADLERAGIPHGDISILAHDGAVPVEKFRDTAGVTDNVARDAQAGGLIGGVAGILMGMTMFAIPGMGLIAAAGWIITALGGAGVGVAAGGIVGILIDVGVPHERAVQYDRELRRGGILLAVRAEDNNVAPVEDLFEEYGATNIEEDGHAIPLANLPESEVTAAG